MEPLSKPSVTARGILMETIMEKPELFKSNEAWISVNDFRDHVIHPYDLNRLQVSYSTNTEAWDAMQDAIKGFPWIETQGSGRTMEFRVKHYPNTLPRTQNDALAEVKHLRSILSKWKDVGQQLIDMTEAVHALKLSYTEAEQLQHRTAALAFYYRSRHTEFCKTRGVSFDDIDPDPMLLEAILADPSKFAEVKILQKAFGILTDEALEKAIEDASE